MHDDCGMAFSGFVAAQLHGSLQEAIEARGCPGAHLCMVFLVSWTPLNHLGSCGESAPRTWLCLEVIKWQRLAQHDGTVE